MARRLKEPYRGFVNNAFKHPTPREASIASAVECAELLSKRYVLGLDNDPGAVLLWALEELIQSRKASNAGDEEEESADQAQHPQKDYPRLIKP